MSGVRRYLGVEVPRPRAAFFELASCEGCQLQMLNREAGLPDFLDLMEIVNFREVMTERSDDYEIAFVEGSVSTEADAARLRAVRERARVLVALGSCACFGGVNRLAGGPRPVAAHVRVDLCIYGCPVRKEEVERVVTDLVLGRPVVYPAYPVCMECKAGEHLCLFDLGEICLGPVTMAGCGAWCPGNRVGCWGCRGPCREPNLPRMFEIVAERGLSVETLRQRLRVFGGFAGLAADGGEDGRTG